MASRCALDLNHPVDAGLAYWGCVRCFPPGAVAIADPDAVGGERIRGREASVHLDASTDQRDV